MKQQRQGLLGWDPQLPLVLTPVPIPDMLGGRFVLVWDSCQAWSTGELICGSCCT